ncbi:Endoribonuclease L-PSP/chorismate mutase-like protein [Pseudomassariella vexata]|uniref:Endoribonuclease L-PSP/chorismate mutase-like protein n=1 Tax=Pseudomassariella vexata TaxID=1141098 RepID=A0A1Y2DSB5_9PEZI|nr:Endoribonuclease L-PSP/chorismate mutase-like protein [Pseudomassariella vexata]ORY62157.1 Endoribonuclease L-PSP/chorismate mutase-like protein [Pseudomassariella vexata]
MISPVRALPIRSILSYTTRCTLARPFLTPVSPVSFTASRKMAGKAPEMTMVMSDKAPGAAAPYSHAVKTASAIYCSGQVHMDPATSKLVTDATIGEKTAICIKNLSAVLESAGSSLQNVVKVNIFIVDMQNDFVPMNEEYKKWFTHRPARSCVAVAALPLGATVEIECVALPGSA